MEIKNNIKMELEIIYQLKDILELTLGDTQGLLETPENQSIINNGYTNGSAITDIVKEISERYI